MVDMEKGRYAPQHPHFRLRGTSNLDARPLHSGVSRLDPRLRPLLRVPFHPLLCRQQLGVGSCGGLTVGPGHVRTDHSQHCALHGVQIEI